MSRRGRLATWPPKRILASAWFLGYSSPTDSCLLTGGITREVFLPRPATGSARGGLLLSPRCTSCDEPPSRFTLASLCFRSSHCLSAYTRDQRPLIPLVDASAVLSGPHHTVRICRSSRPSIETHVLVVIAVMSPSCHLSSYRFLPLFHVNHRTLPIADFRASSEEQPRTGASGLGPSLQPRGPCGPET
jgi:hypothetical protein